MATKKRKVGFSITTTAVDISKEIVIDAMFLTTDLLHSIRNNLPLELSSAQLVETRKVEDQVPSQAKSRRGGKILLAVIALALIMSAFWGVKMTMETREREQATTSAKSALHTVHAAINVDSDEFVASAATALKTQPAALIKLLKPRWDSGRRNAFEMSLLAESVLVEGDHLEARRIALTGLESAPDSSTLWDVYNQSFLNDPEFGALADFPLADNDLVIGETEEISVVIDNQDWRLVLSTIENPDRWQTSVAEYRLCRILNCSFGYSEARPVQLRWEELEFALLDRPELLETLQPDGEYISGALIQKVTADARFPIERSRAWRPILDADKSLESTSKEEAFSSWERRDSEILTRLNDNLGELDNVGIARQISSMVVFDYLVGNYGRFERKRKNFGENVRMAENKLWSASAGESMGVRSSKRARGRLLWVERYSRSNIAAVRALDIDKLASVVFPGTTEVEEKQTRLIRSQIKKLRAHVEGLEQKHGSANVLPFI